MEKLRLKQREEDEIDFQWIDDLIQRYTCGQASCPNETNYCLIVDGVHLKIMPQQLKS